MCGNNYLFNVSNFGLQVCWISIVHCNPHCRLFTKLKICIISSIFHLSHPHKCLRWWEICFSIQSFFFFYKCQLQKFWAWAENIIVFFYAEERKSTPYIHSKLKQPLTHGWQQVDRVFSSSFCEHIACWTNLKLVKWRKKVGKPVQHNFFFSQNFLME